MSRNRRLILVLALGMIFVLGLGACTRQLATAPVQTGVMPSATVPPDVATIQAISAELTAAAGGPSNSMPTPDLAATSAAADAFATQAAQGNPPNAPAPTVDLGVTILTPVAGDLAASTGIAGNLRAPNRGMDPLPLRIVAFNLDTFQIYTQDTAPGQKTYELRGVPAGRYHVVGYWVEGGGAAGYTAAVACGMKRSCTDHTLLTVVVENGVATWPVDLFDWEIEDKLPERP